MKNESDVRMTLPMLKVLALMLDAHPRGVSGADIINEKNVFSGTLYPILKKLEHANWIRGEFENPDIPLEIGRPRKRFYILTAKGHRNSVTALMDLQTRRQPSKLSWKPA